MPGQLIAPKFQNHHSTGTKEIDKKWKFPSSWNHEEKKIVKLLFGYDDDDDDDRRRRRHRCRRSNQTTFACTWRWRWHNKFPTFSAKYRFFGHTFSRFFFPSVSPLSTDVRTLKFCSSEGFLSHYPPVGGSKTFGSGFFLSFCRVPNNRFCRFIVSLHPPPTHKKQQQHTHDGDRFGRGWVEKFYEFYAM